MVRTNAIRGFCRDHPIKVAFLAYWAFVLLFVYLCVVAMYPFKVFELVQPIKFDEPVYAGEMASYTLHYKKHMELPATISRQLVNSNIIVYPDITSNSETGEHVKGSYLEIPKYVSQGMHHMVWTAVYEIPFPFYTRIVTYRFKSEPFEVIKR